MIRDFVIQPSFGSWSVIVHLERGTTREEEGYSGSGGDGLACAFQGLLWNGVVASGLFSITVVASAIVMDCGFCVLMVSYNLALIPVK